MQDRATTVAAGLLEREREFERLEQAVGEAVAGTGCVVAIEGEAGIGKSSLLAYAARCACATGMRVLSARGGELERAFAYGIVRQLFEAPLVSATAEERERWLAGAAGLSAPVLSSAGAQAGGGNAGSILHGLYWLAANLSVEQPLLIAVDDAHWADDASIAVLSYFARRVDELAVIVIYASRLGEGASEALPAVADPALVGQLLRPCVLSDKATAELVSRLLATPSSDEFARACHVATAGNPFLLKELVRALDADAITPDDTSAKRVAQIAPRTIARATLARLRRLGPAANELAFAVAVLGASAQLRHAAALAGLDCDSAARAADALAAAAILSDARPLEFIHPIVRTTVYDELAPGRRATSHKHAARLLAQDAAADAELAPHLLAAEPSGDPWVVERLRRAACDVLERGAPHAASTYLERACREPPAEQDRLSVLLALARAEVQVANPAALAHLHHLLDHATDPEMRFDASVELVVAFAFAGRRDEAIELGSELLAGIPAEDEELRMRFEGWLAATAQFAPAYAKGALDRLSRYEGTLTGATDGERLILGCLAFGAAHRGESSAATVELARRALAGDKLLHDYRVGSANYFLAVWALVYADRIDEAEQYFDRAVATARACGSLADFGAASGCRCQVLIRQGRLAQAETEALSVLSSLQPHAMARSMLLACLLHVMVERADPPAAQAFLVEHGLDGDLGNAPMGGMLLYARGRLRLAGGDAAAALADFDQLYQRDQLSGLDTPGMPSRACRALAHAQLGERDAARVLAAEELRRARRWDTPSALAFALRTAGVVEGGAAGIELLRESAVAVQDSPALYERACSLTELGAALRRAGRRRDAREPLREALDLADRCGALRLAGRARDELIASGARPRRAALTGRDALTPSERRVAQLAADGLSNREVAQSLFVTVRTVEGHLTQAYSKLGIGSREQLAGALAARGALPAPAA